MGYRLVLFSLVYASSSLPVAAQSRLKTHKTDHI